MVEAAPADAAAVAAAIVTAVEWPATGTAAVFAAIAEIGRVVAEDRKHKGRCRWTEWFEQKQLEGCFGAEWG